MTPRVAVRLVPALLALLLLPGLAASAAGQSGRNVLVVVNDASADSVRIGEYYAAARDVPASQVVRLTAPTTETIDRREFESAIEQPLLERLSQQGLHDQVLYIVLTRGVPIRVTGTGGRDGTIASVDSELTLLYRRLLGLPATVRGRVDNPVFLGDQPLSAARPLTRAAHDLYLVTRLDGYSVEDVLALVDRAKAATPGGRVVLDQRGAGTDPGGDRWLFEAAERVAALAGQAGVLLESTTALAETTDPVGGYYSWGSNDPANTLRAPSFRFLPGALGGYFLSADARTFAEPPADWRPGPSLRAGGMFGSGSQSMAADLIRAGLTGMSAHVSDPYLDGVVRPQVLFPAYLAGLNLAEAYYLAMPFLSWQTIVIGDPLCAPYRDRPLADAELWNGMDADTELPALFAERRLDILARDGLNRDALKLALKADVYRSRGDMAVVETLLLDAVAIEPRLAGVWLQLATLAEERADYPLAIERYRRLLDAAPTHVVGLNNLAYALAERAGQPEEALPYAERASRLSSLADVRDTLGWIHHLLGDDRTAARWIESALAAAPDAPEILVHAATVHAALGDLVRARMELNRALSVDPTLAARPDVAALRERIGG